MQLGLPANITDQLEDIVARLRPLLRHLPFVVTIGLLGFLIYVVYNITQILQQPTDTAYQQQQEQTGVQTRFDQATINQIKNLRASNQDPSNPRFGATPTRASPFRE